MRRPLRRQSYLQVAQWLALPYLQGLGLDFVRAYLARAMGSRKQGPEAFAYADARRPLEAAESGTQSAMEGIAGASEA